MVLSAASVDVDIEVSLAEEVASDAMVVSVVVVTVSDEHAVAVDDALLVVEVVSGVFVVLVDELSLVEVSLVEVSQVADQRI